MQNNILVQVTEKMIYKASFLLRSCLIIERLSILNNGSERWLALFSVPWWGVAALSCPWRLQNKNDGITPTFAQGP